jgi:hypothetical protein
VKLFNVMIRFASTAVRAGCMKAFLKRAPLQAMKRRQIAKNWRLSGGRQRRNPSADGSNCNGHKTPPCQLGVMIW